MLLCSKQIFRGDRMNIEFRTVHDVSENERMGQIYAKYCMDNQNKQYKKTFILGGVAAAFSAVVGIATEAFFLPVIGILYLVLVCIFVNFSKKKAVPKAFCEVNNVGCPYNVTFGLYDDYFYEKYESNMLIQESSTRYEFLKKIVETPDYFVLLTKRTQIYFLPKRDMEYEAVLEFSAFCKRRLPYIYTFKS